MLCNNGDKLSFTQAKKEFKYYAQFNSYALLSV